MIFGLFAVGDHGEFGLKDGKLPWGSFKEELEVFYSTLEELRHDPIIIGKNTYESALPRLRKALETRLVYVYGRTKPEFYGVNHKLLTQIGGSFKRVTDAWESDALVLGGATLLHHFYNRGLFDGFIRSTVSRKDGLFHPNSDFHLNTGFFQDSPDATVFLLEQGENEELTFKQETVYL